MSHASKFDIKFKDKRTLFKAMKSLNLRPENHVWDEYPSMLAKFLEIGATSMGKLLTGWNDDFNVFFIEEAGGFAMHVESHHLSDAEREVKGQILSTKLKYEYVRHALENIQNTIIASGQSTRLSQEIAEDTSTLTLEIGASGRKLIVTIDKNGIVHENVMGVTGRSCLDLSFLLENIAAQKVERTWTPEYDEVIEDQVIQVLRLSG